jgi:hypothetical protein
MGALSTKSAYGTLKTETFNWLEMGWILLFHSITSLLYECTPCLFELCLVIKIFLGMSYMLCLTHVLYGTPWRMSRLTELTLKWLRVLNSSTDYIAGTTVRVAPENTVRHLSCWVLFRTRHETALMPFLPNALSMHNNLRQTYIKANLFNLRGRVIKYITNGYKT